MTHGAVLTPSLAHASSYSDSAAVTDQATNIFNGRYTFQNDRRVIAAYLQGTGLTNGRITTPTMRLISYPEIYPFTVGTAPANLPPINFFGDGGPLVVTNDELAVQAGQTSGAAAAADAGLWVQDQYSPPAGGVVTPVKCTAAITGVTRAWVAGPLTFIQQLPAGRYQVVGFAMTGANALFGRLIFPNSPYRPMVVCQQAPGEWDWPKCRSGGMGALGEFHTYGPAQAEGYFAGHGTGASTS